LLANPRIYPQLRLNGIFLLTGPFPQAGHSYNLQCMESRRPSLTAYGAALHRAAHQVVDVPPVFTDPLALRIVGPEVADELRAGRDRHTEIAASRMRAFLAVRSRYTEDCFAQAAAGGVAQYVVLGAGLDTFAYRTDRRDLRIFEVDHPATQGWKRERLASAGIGIPETLTYAPVDFERETLHEGLKRAGLDFDRPAFFAWLGVVPYLSREAIDATLGFVARETKRTSEILFDYAEPMEGRSAAQREALAELARRVAEIGEPLRSFFKPDDLQRDLRAHGFSFVEDADTAALTARYFLNRTDGLALGGTAHIMRARL
jgi:methyltransferase (TIGR00027 family)